MFQLRMFVALALTAAASVAQLERVAYRVAYKAEVRDRAFVQATFFGQGEPPSAVEIPRWSPGAYELKDFAKFLENVSAVDGAGREIAVARVEDASRWTLASKDATWPIVVSYERLDQAEGLMSNRPKARAANYVSFLPTNTFVYA
ncbi:MAG TPA: hypothetical protein VEI02_12245, partial [Planctomycetota bacterium]|nr:hypothetical protein [Planctomycetota bacterium]